MNSLLHQHTESIVSAAIHAVLPDVAVVRALQGYRFGTGKIVLVAAGKAAWQMATRHLTAGGSYCGWRGCYKVWAYKRTDCPYPLL